MPAQTMMFNSFAASMKAWQVEPSGMGSARVAADGSVQPRFMASGSKAMLAPFLEASTILARAWARF